MPRQTGSRHIIRSMRMRFGYEAHNKMGAANASSSGPDIKNTGEKTDPHRSFLQHINPSASSHPHQKKIQQTRHTQAPRLRANLELNCPSTRGSFLDGPALIIFWPHISIKSAKMQSRHEHITSDLFVNGFISFHHLGGNLSARACIPHLNLAPPPLVYL